MPPLVSVIILNWNGLDHLPECLGSLAGQSFRDFEIILVDNGSTDGSIDYVNINFPWVKTICLQENKGFAAGNNFGLEHAVGTYIVTLNNDTKADSNWLKELIETAENMPDVGMIASRICSYHNTDVIDSIGMAICLDGMSRGRFRNKSWSQLTSKGVAEILIPSACAALYRRAMIDEIGFFDEDFFAYAEDTDLGLRGRLSGWKAVAAPEAVVYHKYSQSSGSFSPFKLYLVERNHYWVAIKNFPVTMLLWIPWFTLVRYFEQIRVVLINHGSGNEFSLADSRRKVLWALIKGIFDSAAGIPKMFKKRRNFMKKRRLPWKEFSALIQTHRLSFRELLDTND